MNVERDEEGERLNPFLPVSPKCWSHTNAQALRGDCELGWPGWEARVPPGWEAAGVVLLWGDTGRDWVQQAPVHSPCATSGVLEDWNPYFLLRGVPRCTLQMQTEFFSQVSSSCTKNLCVSQLTATGREKNHPKKRCFSSSLPRQSSSHSCPWHTWLLAELRLVLLCRHRMKHAQCASISRNASSILDYYRGCSVSVSSFCRVWAHIKRDQESLVGCAWLWAQSLLERCVFLDTRLSVWNTYFVEKPYFQKNHSTFTCWLNIGRRWCVA